MNGALGALWPAEPGSLPGWVTDAGHGLSRRSHRIAYASRGLR